MQTSTIKFSQIEDRIDAEYYKPEYLEVEIQLRNSINLENYLTKLETGSWVEKYCFSNGLIPYIKVEQIKDVFLTNTEDKISVECFKIFNNPLLKKGDILMSRVGTVGVASIFLDDTRTTFSDNVIRLKIKNLSPFFLVIFLNSKFGRSQIERLTKQAVQGVINYQSIKSIKIPISSQSFQQKIEKMVREVQGKRKLADKKYKEAEEILNKELGLEDLDLSTQKTFEVKFSEAGDRFDPEYYQLKYKKIVSKLKSQKSKLLNEIVKISDKELDPTKNPSAEIKYVELANINGSSGIIEDCETYKHWQLPGRARMLIKNSDVLVSSLGGSIDKVGLVTEEYDGQVASTGFFVVNSNVLNSETLFLIFRNKIISGQLERNTRGAIMSAISGNEFKNILIPIISKLTQQKISSLIQESFKLRQGAKKLIDRAKKEVEEMVEKR